MKTVSTPGHSSYHIGTIDVRRVLERIVATTDDPSALPLRLALGFMILPHGLQKAFGVFGGYGFDATLTFFSAQFGIPRPLGVADILAEFLGGVALIAGLGTRISAIAVGTVMGVAALLVHLPNGFFMNWFGSQKGEGIEFHLLAIGIAIALAIKGGGRYSIDRILVSGKK